MAVQELEEAPQLTVMPGELSEAAAKILMQPGAPKVSPRDGTALAQLHFALYKVKGDKCFLFAALACVPNVEASLLARIAKHAKYCASDDILKQVDAGMAQVTGG